MLGPFRKRVCSKLWVANKMGCTSKQGTSHPTDLQLDDFSGDHMSRKSFQTAAEAADKRNLVGDHLFYEYSAKSHQACSSMADPDSDLSCVE